MKDLFLKWNEANQFILAQAGIAIDFIFVPDEAVNSNCIAVDYLTKNCLGRVSVWETGNVDAEILDINSEKPLLYEHYECDTQTDFAKLLIKFFRVLRNGS